MKKEDAYIAGEAKAAQAVNCLHEYCYYENLAWASISCLTGLLCDLALPALPRLIELAQLSWDPLQHRAGARC